jgi:hypothetical protein
MKKSNVLIVVAILSIILLFGSAFILLPSGVQSRIKQMAGLTNTRPIVIMVENSAAARPQSGLGAADVVVEAVDEYGITRFVTVFATRDAGIVGPIRSSRPYYAEIAKSFDPIYVFFGTYPECYKYIQDLGMYTMSAMTDASGQSSIVGLAPYWRDWNRSSIQEHTAFTSTIAIKQRAATVGYPLDGNGIPFSYKGDAAEPDRGGISNIYIDFSTDTFAPRGFNVNFKYDRNSNSYLRYMGGAPHVDHETGQIITVKNVIVLTTDVLGPVDKYNHMNVRTTGSGQAYYFIDGNAVQGSWERGGVGDPFTFKDSNGDVVSLNAGNTWISIIQPGKVSFN